MKSEKKLTSVNILKDVYFNFKMKTINTDMSLQKFVNRAMDLYNNDEIFKEKINNHKTIGLNNSKY